MRRCVKPSHTRSQRTRASGYLKKDCPLVSDRTGTGVSVTLACWILELGVSGIAKLS